MELYNQTAQSKAIIAVIVEGLLRLLDIAGLQPKQCPIAVLGAPSRAGAAHVMQFRPVGVEGGGQDATPIGLEAGGRAGQPGALDRRRRRKGRNDRGHDADSLLLLAALAAVDAIFRVENQLWPDSLKDSFNCPDLSRSR